MIYGNAIEKSFGFGRPVGFDRVAKGIGVWITALENREDKIQKELD